MKSAITLSAVGAAIAMTTSGAYAIDIDAGDYSALPPGTRILFRLIAD